MKQRLLGISRLILFLILFYLLPYPIAQAQSSTPEIEELLVELWPEYDRPEVLVIYRIRLSPDTALPARLTFRLPGYLDQMHAVAIEQEGALVDVNPNAIELRHEAKDSILSFASASPNVQLEYYDGTILSKADQTRQLQYEFTAPYDIETVTFAVQEPFEAENFSMTPEATQSFIGTNGLRYNNLEIAGMSAAEEFSLTATYQRSTNDLSIAGLANVPDGLSGSISDQPLDLDDAGGTILGDGNRAIFGYLLVGGGVGLLIATAGYWWWSTRMKREEFASPSGPRRSSRRPGRRPKRPDPSQADLTPGPSPSAPAQQPTGGYCYRCGTALRPEANFCHICGAERRKS